MKFVVLYRPRCPVRIQPAVEGVGTSDLLDLTAAFRKAKKLAGWKHDTDGEAV